MQKNSVGAKDRNSVSLTLVGVLAVIIVLAIVFTMSSKLKPADPTLTAAPPIIATTDHPIVVHRKSAEVLALMLEQNGQAGSPGTAGQGAAKQ